MITSTVPRAGVSPFAHLGRVAPAAAGKAEDDDKKDDAKSKAEDDEDAKSKKAADDDDEPMDKDKDDDAAKKGKKAKKGKTSDDSDDDDGDRKDDDDPSARAARARERSRIRAIMTSDAGKAFPAAAMHLAVGTSMPRDHVIETLSAMQAATAAEPKGQRDALRDRMAKVDNPTVGADGGRSGPSLAEQIVLAGKKRRGEI